MGGKVCLRCKGKTLLGVVNKLFVFKSLLTSPSNVLLYPFSQVNFPANNLNFHWRWRWWDRIQAIFSNLFYFATKIENHICYNKDKVNPKDSLLSWPFLAPLDIAQVCGRWWNSLQLYFWTCNNLKVDFSQEQLSWHTSLAEKYRMSAVPPKLRTIFSPERS